MLNWNLIQNSSLIPKICSLFSDFNSSWKIKKSSNKEHQPLFPSSEDWVFTKNLSPSWCFLLLWCSIGISHHQRIHPHSIILWYKGCLSFCIERPQAFLIWSLFSCSPISLAIANYFLSLFGALPIENVFSLFFHSFFSSLSLQTLHAWNVMQIMSLIMSFPPFFTAAHH